jgi:lipid II:glycine glycyltransferase (peptidoglycan interpeptide bridge formation enzyme)
MMRVVPLQSQHREAWDALVASHPASGFMQSWAWSTFKELDGYTAVRLGLFDGDALRGGGIAYTFPTPAEASLAVMPDGPVLDWDTPGAPVAFQALVSAFRNSTAGRRVVALRVEPRLTVAPEPLRDLPRAPVDLVPDETLMVDLGREPLMLARMRPKGRYNARLALRRGVEVSSSADPADVHEFFFVLEQTARYQDFRLEPKRFFINLVQAMFPGVPSSRFADPFSAPGAAPSRAPAQGAAGSGRRGLPQQTGGAEEGTGRFAFARYKGITLAAALTVRHGDTVTYVYGGHLPLFPDVMASYALHWHILREAAAEGYRCYDFYGFVPAGHLDHPYDRFSRFKEKFGGRPVRWIGSRDVVFHDRLAEAALRAIHSVSAGSSLAETASPTRHHRGEES